MMETTPELEFAISAVRRAAGLVEVVQREMVTAALTKGDRSPVTVGDYAAQAIVGRLLEETFPDDPLVGEEDAGQLRTPEGEATLAQVRDFVAREIPGATSESVCTWIDRGGAEATSRFWTVDPIDGTKGFLRREQYAVCLALVEEGAVRLAVIGCPNLSPRGEPDVGGAGGLFFAVRGEGAWANALEDGGPPQAIRCSSSLEIGKARLLRSVESGHTHGGKIDELTAALGVEAEPVRMDSQAKYAVLAAGGGELLLRLLSPSRPDYREKIWDQAAGSLLVEEAGGRVSDLDGKPLDFSAGRTLARNRGLLASNGTLHDATLRGLADVGA